MSKYGFLIASGDKQPLTEACVTEFGSIMRERRIRYPSGKLTDQSTGTLSIVSDTSPFAERSRVGQKITFLFDNVKTGKEESIASDSFSTLKYISDPLLTQNKLYYFDTSTDNPNVHVVDIFTGQHNIIPLPYDEKQPIHSFFVRGDSLYYLAGTFCNDNFMKCNLVLKRYDLKFGTDEVLAVGVKGRYIGGFNPAGDALILEWSYGDAGCGSALYESFTFANKSLKQIVSYSYCEGEQMEGSFETLENLVAGIGRFYHLIIKNGGIFVPKEKEDLTLFLDRVPILVDTTIYGRTR